MGPPQSRQPARESGMLTGCVQMQAGTHSTVLSGGGRDWGFRFQTNETNDDNDDDGGFGRFVVPIEITNLCVRCVHMRYICVHMYTYMLWYARLIRRY